MDKLRRLSTYIDAYYAAATQHRTSRIARQWMEAGVPATDAAAWASLGFLPAEAAQLIAAGVTPEMAQVGDEIAVNVAGSPEERAMQVIDRLVADGVLVDPARVRQSQDPDDPQHTIVHIDPQ
jgi:hypothetical protein